MKKLSHVVFAGSLLFSLTAFAGTVTVTDDQSGSVTLKPNPNTLMDYCVTDAKGQPFASKTLSADKPFSLNDSDTKQCAGKMAFTISGSTDDAAGSCAFTPDASGKLEKSGNAGLCNSIQLSSDGSQLTVK